jgi:hypothetical protein
LTFTAFSRPELLAKSLQPLFDLDITRFPDLKEPVQVLLKDWNRVSNINEVCAYPY